MLETTPSTATTSDAPFGPWTSIAWTPVSSWAIARTRWLEPDGDAALLDALREPLPHLPRAEPRVVELLDQARDVCAA